MRAELFEANAQLANNNNVTIANVQTPMRKNIVISPIVHMPPDEQIDFDIIDKTFYYG